MCTLVSIVTPSFNQAQFLEETIHSVLNQTYKNIEYIIIDGGSTDGSVDIIKKYQSSLKYWISEKDNGQSHALNKGYAKCSGDIFAYLNSDDILEPGAVARIVDAFSETPHCAMIYGQCTYINQSGNPITSPQGGKISYRNLLQFKMTPAMNQPSVFFKKEFLTRFPLFKNELRYVMDYDLILHLAKTNPYRFIPVPVSRFRYHQHSKSISCTREMFMEKIMVQMQIAPLLFPLWVWRILYAIISHIRLNGNLSIQLYLGSKIIFAKLLLKLLGN